MALPDTVTIQTLTGGAKTQPVKTDALILQEASNGTCKYSTLDDLRPFLLRANLIADGTALHTSTAETVLATFTVPANYWRAGEKLRVTASGEFGATATPTLTLRVRAGGVAGLLLASFALTATAQTSKQWSLVADATARTVGASASFAPGYALAYLYGSGSTGNQTSALVTVDTTASNAVCVTAQWGTSNVLNTIFSRTFSVEILPASATS